MRKILLLMLVFLSSCTQNTGSIGMSVNFPELQTKKTLSAKSDNLNPLITDCENKTTINNKIICTGDIKITIK